MEWQSWVWRLSANRRMRKSLLGSIGLLLVWSIAWGPLVEWRQQVLLDRMQPFLDGMSDGVAPPLDQEQPSPKIKP